MSSLPTVGSFLLLKNAWEAWIELHKTNEKHELNDISEHGMFCVSGWQRSRRWFRSCVTEGFSTIAVHCLHVTLTSLSWSLAFPIARGGVHVRIFEHLDFFRSTKRNLYLKGKELSGRISKRNVDYLTWHLDVSNDTISMLCSRL